jgi:WD40 repeat protein
MMSETRTCPKCDRDLPDDAPRGLCPACLLAAALAVPGDTEARDLDSHEPTTSHAGRTASEPGRAVDRAGASPVATVDFDSRQSTAADDPATPGTIRHFGDYALKRLLGRGGMGEVWLAEQTSLDNRPVAVKTLRAGSLDAKDRARFRNEAEAIAALDHPNLVEVYEVGEHQGQPYYSMKLYAGGSLADHLAEFRDDPGRAATVVAAVARAVHHAHQRAILHRDLKPANVLLDERGAAHVTDFGLAKRLDHDLSLSLTGEVMGTPAFMAPEQTTGRKGAVTIASDVYGLGAILYCLVTGRAPFQGDSVPEVLQAVREHDPEPPSRLNPRVPRDLEVICQKCLMKDPRRRYGSALELTEDLELWLAGKPIGARPVGVLERSLLFVRRRPTLAAAYGLAAAVLVLAVFAGTVAWLWKTAERDRAEAIVARNGAAQARAIAEKSRDGERQARAEVERQREKFERSDYSRTIQVAQQELRDNNVGATVALLQGTRADFRGWEWHYVDRLCHTDLLTFDGHAGLVLSASFSPDGSRVVTASADKTAKVWDAKTGAEVLSLKGHGNGLSSASFSPDGSRVVTASDDGTLKLWDATRGSVIRDFEGHNNDRPRVVEIWSASFSPDGSRVVTGFGNGTATVWDAKTGAAALSLKGHTDRVTSTVFSPDGSRVATSSEDGTAKVFDAKTASVVLSLKGHFSPILSASFSPDGSRVVTTGGDKTAKVWDAKTGAELSSLGHTERVTSAAFSRDGSRIVTGSQDRTAKVWDANTGAELLSIDSRSAQGIVSVAFSRDGSRVVTASLDGTVNVWDAKSGIESLALKTTFGVMSASFSPDGSRIVTAGDDRTPMVWDAKTGAQALALKGHADSAFSASFSLDGSRIVTASRDGTAKVWDAKTGAMIRSLDAHGSMMTTASFSPDGSRVVTGSIGGTEMIPRRALATVWDAATGTELFSFKGHTFTIASASFSLDGSRVVTTSYDETAKVWDAKTGAEVLTIKGHRANVNSVSYSPDGSRLVTAGSNGKAKVWDAKTGAEILTFRGYGSKMISAAFSPDGLRVVSTGLDGNAKVWDTKTGAELFVLKGPPDPVLSARFSPDGTRVVTAHMKGTATVWDVNTGAEVLTLKGHTHRVQWASFSPDGSRIVTASLDGTAKVWDAKASSEGLALKGHTGIVSSASFSPDGSRVVTAGADRTTKVWDAKTGAEVLSLKGHAQPIRSASFSPDGSRIVTAGADGTAKVWDAKSGAEALTLKGHTGIVFSASFSPDGSRIVTAGDDRTAKVWDAKTGAEALTLKGHTEIVLSASFSPDGSRIVTAGADGTAKVWDAKTAIEVLSLKGHTNVVTSASFSADGSRIISSSWDATARVWDARPISSPKASRKKPPPGDTKGAVHVSPPAKPDVSGGPPSTTERQLPSPAVPRLVAPSPGALMDNSRQDRRDGISWEFDWSDVPGATAYHLYVIGPTALNPVINRDGLVVSGYHHESRGYIVRLKGWRWKVRAMVDGAWGPWSEERTFDVEPVDQDPPTVGGDGAGVQPPQFPAGTRVTTPFPLVPGQPRPGPPPGDTKGAVRANPPAKPGVSGGPTSTTERPSPGTQERSAREQNTAATQLPEPVLAALAELRKKGKNQLADELTNEIKSARTEVDRWQTLDPQSAGHVIMGRIVADGLEDASRVTAQMRVHPEGYFVGPVAYSGRPVGFLKQGYLSAVITPVGAPGSTEYVGEVHLPRMTDATSAGLKGKFMLVGTPDVRSLKPSLTLFPRPLNTPDNLRVSSAPHDSVSFKVAASGEFTVPHLSPAGYGLSLFAPGYEKFARALELKPGETHDLGTIRLERAKRVVITYRLARGRSFRQAPTSRLILPDDGHFKFDPQDPGSDLVIQQGGGRLWFVDRPPGLTDLGAGRIDDFLELDARSPSVSTAPRSVVPQPGHVYLLDRTSKPGSKSSALFQIQFEMKPPK